MRGIIKWPVVLAIILVAVIFFFLVLSVKALPSVMSASRFSGQCGNAIFWKILLTRIWPLQVFGFLHSLPTVKDSCSTVVSQIKVTTEEELADEIYKMARNCFYTFGGGDFNWLHDEGVPLFPCFILFYDRTSDEDFNVTKMIEYINKTYGEEINSSQFSMIWIKPNRTGGDIAEFIDMNSMPNLSKNGTIEIYFLDWRSALALPIPGHPEIPCPTDQAFCCGVDENLRKTVLLYYGQADLPFNGFIESHEVSTMMLVVGSATAGIINIYEVPKYCGLIWPCTWNSTKVYGICKYHKTDCGYLTKAMSCCNDKVIICVKSG